MRKSLFLILSFCFCSLTSYAQAVADFSADTTQGCAPLQVTFINQSNAAGSYQWYFGDGNHSTVTTPTNLYTEEGEFEVTLIALHANGNDTLVKTAYIKVYPKPEVNYSINDSTQCLIGDSVSFMNQGDTTHQYTWIFGDGHSTTTFHASYRYSSVGNYQSQLVAESAFGCTNSKSINQSITVIPNPTADFSVDTNLVCEPNRLIQFRSTTASSIDHYWDFGDGTKDSLNNSVAHIYDSVGRYDVSLHLEDSNGCKSSISKNSHLRFHLPSEAVIELEEDTICSRQRVSIKVDSQWISANWNFGDGGESQLLQPSYQFSRPGIYAPEVTLTDSVGCVETLALDSLNVYQTPIASVRDSILSDCVPFVFQPKNTSFFTNQYHWKVGPQESTKENPRILLKESGIYNLQLIGSNDFCSDTLHLTEWLSLQGGQASTLISDSVGCAPLSIDFSVIDTTFQRVEWHFGNGDSATSPKVNYTYEEGGQYRAFVITVTQMGCRDTTDLSTIQVFDAQSVFDRPDTLVLCQPGSVSFDGSSIGGSFWRWDFGDENYSNQANPSHFFDSAGVYTVKLLTENSEGCYYRLNPYNVVIVKEQKANFNFTIENCPDFKVSFTSTDSNLTAWKWEFGDGTEDTVQNPIHYYAEEGYYTISLSTWDRDGCYSKNSIIYGLELFPCIGDSVIGGGLGGSKGSSANLIDSSSVIVGCAPFKLDFAMPFDSIKSQHWFFGDGQQSTKLNPTHWYHQAGNYTITLIIEDFNGQFDTLRNENYIQLGNPKADFNTVITNTCDSTEVTFQNRSDRSSQYLWKLGDAGSSSAFNAHALYEGHSNQLISLTAIDEKGCSHTINKNLTVGIPNPYFSFPSKACLGDTIHFMSNIKHYERLEWIIGNQSIYGDTIQFVPMDTGSFSVRLKAYDQKDCFIDYTANKQLTVSDPQANFSINGSLETCDQLSLNVSNLSTGATSYQWYFGNGDSSKMETPNYVYSEKGAFFIRLKAKKGGCESSKTADNKIIINKAKVDYEIQQNGFCLPIQTHFFDRSDSAISWNWEFGDGSFSSDQNPIHIFTTESAVQKLSIVDVNGCRATLSKKALQTHRANPIADRWEGCAPLTINFNDSTKNVSSYFWDFGDGNTSFSKNPQHTFTDSGSYSITLITRANEGCYDTLHLPNSVIAGRVVADFVSESDTTACAPHLTSFQNSSVGATNYQWNFGDQTRSTHQNPMKVYHKAGLFDVSLIADNGHSCYDTLIQDSRFLINTPEINFSINDTSFCGPSEVKLNDLSKRVQQRKWFFGDGTTSADKEVTHLYDQEGSYQLTLMVTDTAGCIEHLSQQLHIKQKPSASFALDTTSGCSPVNINFTNQSSNLSNPYFTWQLNQRTFTKNDLRDTTISFNQAGSYDIGLIAVNSNKCKDTSYKAGHLKVYQPKKVMQPKIWTISRTDSNQWKLKWEENQEFEFDHYQLYRKTTDGRFEAFMKFEDQKKTELILPYRSDWKSRQCFKMEVVYHCVNPIGPDSLAAYCSIDLSTITDSLGIQASWNPYQTATYDHFELWRKPTGSNEFHLVSRVDMNESTFLDTTILCPESYTYRLNVKNIYGQGYEAWSDTTTAFPLNNIKETSISIKRATVVDEHQVLLEWDPLHYSEQVVSGLKIDRSQSRGGFKTIAHLPLTASAYLDEQTNADQRSIRYQISLSHQCRNSLNVEKEAASIWLQIEGDGSVNYLKWTEAKGLKGGVERYHIQKKNEFGQWETIKTVGPEQLDSYLDVFQLE